MNGEGGYKCAPRSNVNVQLHTSSAKPVSISALLKNVDNIKVNNGISFVLISRISLDHYKLVSSVLFRKPQNSGRPYGFYLTLERHDHCTSLDLSIIVIAVQYV